MKYDVNFTGTIKIDALTPEEAMDKTYNILIKSQLDSFSIEGTFKLD